MYIIGAYSNIPYGVSDTEADKIVSGVLRSLLNKVYKNKNIKIVLGLSTALYDWIEKNRPEISMLIYDLVRKEQIELLSSPFYNNLIPFMHQQERINSIEKTNTFIRKRFLRKPHGLWCPYGLFSSSLVTSLSYANIDYLIIANEHEPNKPFKMDELGKNTTVFPADGQINAYVNDRVKNRLNDNKLYQNIKKRIASYDNSLRTIMLSLDDLAAFSDDNAEVFETVFSTLNNKYTLPMQYLAEHEVNKTDYLPDGIYGFDLNLMNNSNLNREIMQNSHLCRLYSSTYLLYELVKQLKRNTDSRFVADNLILKIFAGTAFLKKYPFYSKEAKEVSKAVCSLEDLYAREKILPVMYDFDKDGLNEYIICNSYYISYLNLKGGLISHLNVLCSKDDLAFNDSDGLFSDRIVVNDREIKLENKKFSQVVFDKKNSDYFVSYVLSLTDSSKIQIVKNFRFRGNSICCAIKITNISENTARFNYTNCLAMNLPFVFSSSDEPRLANGISSSDRTALFNFSIETDKLCTYSIQNNHSYAKVNITDTINLKRNENYELSINFKTEKRKEKNGTEQQSNP